jgi:predicted dehydrogenase
MYLIYSNINLPVKTKIKMTKRREFIKTSVIGTAGLAIGGLGFSSKSYASIIGANERINMAVCGFGGRGQSHLSGFSSLKDSHNVRVLTVCDVEEKFWADAVKTVSDKSGFAPGTEWDMRKVFDNKDIHAVSFATPNHWHALGTIWACQAGKHVYVEKPISHNISEGRKMIEAGIKYKVHIQTGFGETTNEAMKFLHDGGIGDVYMARGLCIKPRDSFGIAKDGQPPASLHYDMWLGPAPMRPYNEKRVHYNWNWFWATGCGDTGNQGSHQLNAARVGLQKNEHPVSVSSEGGIYALDPKECEQETPNTQCTILKYKDGKMIVFDTRGMYSNTEGSTNVAIGNIFYGTEGYMEYGNSWKAFRKREKEPFAGAGIGERKGQSGRGPSAFVNFIDVLRSGKDEDLINPVVGGHYSTVLPHLANISYKVGRGLKFDGAKEKFVNDPEADKLLTRVYRKPFIVPEKI